MWTAWTAGWDAGWVKRRWMNLRLFLASTSKHGEPMERRHASSYHMGLEHLRKLWVTPKRPCLSLSCVGSFLWQFSRRSCWELWNGKHHAMARCCISCARIPNISLEKKRKKNKRNGSVKCWESHLVWRSAVYICFCRSFQKCWCFHIWRRWLFDLARGSWQQRQRVYPRDAHDHR